MFMGVATSITALPVLASIVRDRGLAGTTSGVIATAAAGIMDVLAWLVLAAALIGTGHSGRFSLPVMAVLICCFAIVMLVAVRPALSWWTNRSQSVLSSPVPIAFVLAMTSAWVTASLDLHPIFGAFLAGLTMLPLFFVITGLQLNVGGVRGDAFVLLAVIIVSPPSASSGPATRFPGPAALRRVSRLASPRS